jgi:hypothetical protein
MLGLNATQVLCRFNCFITGCQVPTTGILSDEYLGAQM